MQVVHFIFLQFFFENLWLHYVEAIMLEWFNHWKGMFDNHYYNNLTIDLKKNTELRDRQG